MKSFQLITLVTVIAASSATQALAQVTNAPLYLFIHGSGSVSPLTNGELLEVGQPCSMVAIPNAGFAFNSWQPVNVFAFTEFLIDTNGNAYPRVSISAAPVPAYTNQPSLDFIMQPEVVIFDSPGIRTITESWGWEANFEPITLSIQFGDSAVILTWTNSSCTLQAASAPSGAYTNILGAISPYTNDISGPAHYFRLISN